MPDLVPDLRPGRQPFDLLQPGPSVRILPADEVHLWWAPADRLDDQALAQLAPDEHAQAGRFAFERDQHRHLATRWLLRSTLSRYAPVQPADWRFSRNAWGRPAICGPPLAVPLHFSLSHSGHWVVLALARFSGIGIDIEGQAPDDMDSIVQGFFAAAEQAWWQQAGSAPGQRHQRFLTLWTLKEAYAKARGRGLSLPLRDFAVLPGEHGRALLLATTAVDADAGAWKAWHGPGPDAMAVAVLMRPLQGVEPRLVVMQAPVEKSIPADGNAVADAPRGMAALRRDGP